MKKDFMENREGVAVTTKIAGRDDWQEYKKIRIEALIENPEAFGETLEQALEKSDDVWQSGVEDSAEKFVCLVKSDSKTVGMGGGKKREDFGADSWFVFGMYISKSSRGQKAGEKLLVSIEKEMRQRGAKKIVLFVGPNQEPAISLYKKLGFIENIEKNSSSSDGRVWVYMDKSCEDDSL